MADKKHQQSFCNKCLNRQFEYDYNGFFCGLTNAAPSFESDCPDYTADKSKITDVARQEVFRKQIELEDDTGWFHKIGIKNGITAGAIGIVIATVILGIAFFNGDVIHKGLGHLIIYSRLFKIGAVLLISSSWLLFKGIDKKRMNSG